MNKYTRTIILSLIFVAAVILLENFLFRFLNNREEKRSNISMILFDEGKKWDDVKAGATQAADDGCDINYVVMPTGSSAKDQFDAINDEIERGADYVIVAAVDSFGLRDELGDKYTSNVSFVGNGIDNDKYITVEPDNYLMGINIGNLVIEEENPDSKVVIIDNGSNKEYILDRINGVKEVLEESGITFEIWEFNPNETGIVSYAEKIDEYQPDLFIVLNEEAISTTIEMADESDKPANIYAIANSDEAVYYLDNKKIKYLIYPDEFGMGYAAVKRVIDKSAYVNDDFKRLITYKVVNRDDMYTSGYEKVLFPFVK